jgi:hypothetical protein
LQLLTPGVIDPFQNWISPRTPDPVSVRESA